MTLLAHKTQYLVVCFVGWILMSFGVFLRPPAQKNNKKRTKNTRAQLDDIISFYQNFTVSLVIKAYFRFNIFFMFRFLKRNLWPYFWIYEAQLTNNRILIKELISEKKETKENCGKIASVWNWKAKVNNNSRFTTSSRKINSKF